MRCLIQGESANVLRYQDRDAGFVGGRYGAFYGDPTTFETASWRERIVTVVATAIGVLIIATVAVLMGMA